MSLPVNIPSFGRLNASRKLSERGIRSTQALLGIATFLGCGNRVIPFTKGLSLVKATHLLGDMRAVLFAFEMPATLMLLKEEKLMDEARKDSKARNPDEFARQTIFLGAYITLDVALFASFYQNQLPRMVGFVTGNTPHFPPFPAANFFTTKALSPALTTLFVTGLMDSWNRLRTGEAQNRHTNRLQFISNATDLSGNLFPLVLGNPLGGIQKDLLSLTTGTVGGYVIWTTFPKQ